MAAEIEYEKRSIWRNIFDPGAWQNLLSGVGEIAGEAASTWEQIEKMKPEEGPREPTITWREFKFKPNWTLILVGCGVLGLALIIKMRK